MTFVFKHPSKYVKNPTLVKNMKHVKNVLENPQKEDP